MKIVLYSTNSEFPNDTTYNVEYPSRSAIWDDIAKKYEEHEIIVVTKFPASYVLLDTDKGGFINLPKKVKFEILPVKANDEDFADKICSLKPDIVMDISIHSFNNDWGSLANSIVGDILRNRGINVASNSINTALTFFNKWYTHTSLKEKGFNVPNAVYINYNLLNTDKEFPELTAVNQYKEYIFYEIKKLKFPIIIKSVTGTNSAGICIAKTFEDACNFLNSNSTKTDFIVEEFISGIEYGVEISGTEGHYEITSPFLLSSGNDGVTYPLSNIKLGPVTNVEKYNLIELRKEMLRLANEYKICVNAQIDLIYDGQKYYILEVNLRCSGMTPLTCSSKGVKQFETYIEYALQYAGEKNEQKNKEEKYSIHFKLNNPKTERLEELAKINHIDNLMIIESPEFKYYSVVFGGFDTILELIEETKLLQEKFSDIMDYSIIESIEKNIDDFT